MKAYNAVSGFRDEDLPLFRNKLDFLYDVVSSEPRETGFQRVLDIAELPDFLEDHKMIDTPKLIRARASSELRDFRKWLPTIKSSSDSQIMEERCGRSKSQVRPQDRRNSWKGN